MSEESDPATFAAAFFGGAADATSGTVEPPQPEFSGSPVDDASFAAAAATSTTMDASSTTTIGSIADTFLSSEQGASGFSLSASNAVLRTNSFDPSNAGKNGPRAPSVSDLELIFNVAKVILYFASIILCALPALSDAAAFPVEEEDDMVDESERPFMRIIHGASGEPFALVPGGEEEAASGAATSSRLRNNTSFSFSSTSSSSLSPPSSAAARKKVGRWQAFKQKVSSFKRTTLHTVRIFVALAATVLCAYTTWTHIIQFMVEDASRFSTLRRWIVKSDFFTIAYLKVTETPAQFFWSSQLLLFVPSYVLWLLIAYARAPSRQRFFPLCNVWVGCGVAISACVPLALSAAHASAESWPEQAARYSVPFRVIVVVPLLAAFAGVLLLPMSLPRSESVHDNYYASTTSSTATGGSFGIVLALIHLGVIIPPIVCQFFPHYVSNPAQKAVIVSEAQKAEASIAANKKNSNAASSSSTSFSPLLVPVNIRDTAQRGWLSRTAASLWIPITFTGFALGCGLMHLVYLNTVVQEVDGDALLSTLYLAFCANSCQCSISLDVAQCSLLVVAFLWAGALAPRLRWAERVALTLSVPLLGLGFAFSTAVAIDEIRCFFERMTNGFSDRFLVIKPTVSSACSSSALPAPLPAFKSATSVSGGRTVIAQLSASGRMLQISPSSSKDVSPAPGARPATVVTANKTRSNKAASADDLDKTFTVLPGKKPEAQPPQQKKAAATKASSSSGVDRRAGGDSSVFISSDDEPAAAAAVVRPRARDARSGNTTAAGSAAKEAAEAEKKRPARRPLVSASPTKKNIRRQNAQQNRRSGTNDSEYSSGASGSSAGNLDRQDLDERSSGLVSEDDAIHIDESDADDEEEEAEEQEEAVGSGKK